MTKPVRKVYEEGPYLLDMTTLDCRKEIQYLNVLSNIEQDKMSPFITKRRKAS